MANDEIRERRQAYWPLPEDLKTLHDAIIEYAIRIQTAAAAEHEKLSKGRLSHSALFTLHRTAIVTHRSIRSLCETGWTPATPILIRTLLDILASSYAVVAIPEGAEFMAFKFMASYLIEAISDPDTTDALRTYNKEQLEGLRRQCDAKEIKRFDEFIGNFKPQAYWYRPEFNSPGAIFKEKIPRLFFMYRQFSGSVHASLIGSLLFDDSPDTPDINPQEHPVNTRNAIVASSRLLLDTSWARGTFEGVTEITEYNEILKKYILPQEDKTGPKK